MRETEFCNHYRAMSDHATCNMGVAYETFKGLPFDRRPCFERNGVAPPGCTLAEFPTVEERAERERMLAIRMEQIGRARQAIVDHLGGPWRGKPAAAGTIDCPACDGQGTLQFSRAGYNGHILARCATEGCVRWLE